MCTYELPAGADTVDVPLPETVARIRDLWIKSNDWMICDEDEIKSVLQEKFAYKVVGAVLLPLSWGFYGFFVIFLLRSVPKTEPLQAATKTSDKIVEDGISHVVVAIDATQHPTPPIRLESSL
jgi:hypothetical protein